MNSVDAVQSLNASINWPGFANLGIAIATICSAAYITWFVWIIHSQLIRLRNGEIQIQKLFSETARALLVVLGVLVMMAFLNM